MATAYDYKPVSNSKYVKLKSKGDKAILRIVSDPLIFLESITDKDTGEVLDKEQFAWIVIDKTDETKPKVKGWKGSASVFLKIKRLTEMKGWGDPTTYDIEVERVEDPGAAFWSVTPIPPSSPLSKAEIDLAKEANINLVELFKVDESRVLIG